MDSTVHSERRYMSQSRPVGNQRSVTFSSDQMEPTDEEGMLPNGGLLNLDQLQVRQGFEE